VQPDALSISDLFNLLACLGEFIRKRLAVERMCSLLNRSPHDINCRIFPSFSIMPTKDVWQCEFDFWLISHA
jgi:hypothetical protein